MIGLGVSSSATATTSIFPAGDANCTGALDAADDVLRTAVALPNANAAWEP